MKLKLEVAKKACRLMSRLGVLANPTITNGGKGVGFRVSLPNGDDLYYRVRQSIFRSAKEVTEFAQIAATRARGIRA